MNLAIRGIDAQIAHGDTLHDDSHPDMRADFIVTTQQETILFKPPRHARGFHPGESTFQRQGLGR